MESNEITLIQNIFEQVSDFACLKKSLRSCIKRQHRQLMHQNSKLKTTLGKFRVMIESFKKERKRVMIAGLQFVLY